MKTNQFEKPLSRNSSSISRCSENSGTEKKSCKSQHFVASWHTSLQEMEFHLNVKILVKVQGIFKLFDLALKFFDGKTVIDSRLQASFAKSVCIL